MTQSNLFLAHNERSPICTGHKLDFGEEFTHNSISQQPGCHCVALVMDAFGNVCHVNRFSGFSVIRLVFQAAHECPHPPSVSVAIQHDFAASRNTIPQLDADSETLDARCIVDGAAPWQSGKQTPFVDADPLFFYPVNEGAAGVWGRPCAAQLKEEGVVEGNVWDLEFEGIIIALFEHACLLGMCGMPVILLCQERLARREHVLFQTQALSVCVASDKGEHVAADIRREQEKHFYMSVYGDLLHIYSFSVSSEN